MSNKLKLSYECLMTELHEKIKKYYEDSQLFYDWFWMNKKNLGMHYGFWEKGTRTLHQAIINENKAVAEKLKIEKGDIVLDAGCGVGGTAIWLAENYGVKVVGINISEKQVELAKKYAKERGVDRLVTFEIRDFCNTGFPDGSFTKIFAIESACHAERKEDFIKEAFRLLKPGGRLVVADGFLRRKELSQKDQRLYRECCEGWAVPSLSTIEEFTKKLEKTRFQSIEFTEKTKQTNLSSIKMYIIIGIFLYPILKFLNLLKLVSRTRLQHAKTGLNQHSIFKKQIGIYGLFSATKL